MILKVFIPWVVGSISVVAIAAGQSDGTVEGFLQSLSTVPGAVNRRDPFMKLSAPFEMQAAQGGGETSISAPILERFPPKNYYIVAVLLGDAYPRALVRTPEPDKKVLIVKEKDRLGSQGGVIKKITRDGLVLVKRKHSKFGFIEEGELLLHVGTGGQ